MRTEAERNAAVERLEENKTKCKQFSMFGDDNHANIDAMIEVINVGMDEDDVYNKHGDLATFDAAWQALEFLRGEAQLDELLYPEND